jgi:pSer/pThr/pTyr-binding forkhead associated (FHA) protein
MGIPQFRSGLKFSIRIQRGPLAGQTYSYDKAVVEIGRGTENDLVLANDLRASRKHAEIRWDGKELQVVNISSKNFLAVNGSEVERAKLESGAIVIVGETEFRIDFKSAFQNEFSEPKTKINFTEPVDIPEPVFIQMPVLQQARPTPIQPSMAPMNPGVTGGAAGRHPNYGTNLPGPIGHSRPRPRVGPSHGTGKSNSKIGFYAVVVLVVVIFAWLMNSNSIKKKELSFRSSEQIEKDIEISREELKEFEVRKEKLDNVQFRRAQENYIRGFRDYKQGNFGRARESFQVVLNLDPDNELAKRYYQLAKLKFDELVKFHMLQGNRYREKKNWRMCKSSYFNVMTMVSNNQDPVFKEARQYFDQCSLAQEGRY